MEAWNYEYDPRDFFWEDPNDPDDYDDRDDDWDDDPDWEDY